MKTSVYIESSVISYITARASKDLIAAGRQVITQDWWQEKRSGYDVFVSTLVEQEISKGNQDAANKRLAAISDIKSLDISEEAQMLAASLLTSGAVPQNSAEDALHIGIAAANGIQYLLTWNFKHINNAKTKALIQQQIENQQFLCPVLCSPEELG